MDFPAVLYYLIEHQVWARLDGDGSATVGVTALGIRQSGEIFMCRPQRVGKRVEQGRSVAVVELAKSIVSVKSPVTGRVIATNEQLENRPELVHLDPYGNGWVARIEVEDFAADQVRLLHGDAVVPAMVEHARLNRIEWTP